MLIKAAPRESVTRRGTQHTIETQRQKYDTSGTKTRGDWKRLSYSPPPHVGSTDFLYSNEHLIEISMLKNLKVSEIIEEKINVVGVVVSTSDNFLYFQYFKK